MKISWLLDKSGPGRAQNWLIRASVHGLNTEPAVGWFDQPMGQMPRWHDQHAFPLCISKQKGLAINSENSTKAYLNEMKQVIALLAGMSRKNAGGENEGIFHYVIENKWCKNARNRPFHYVDENKCSYKQLSIMLMKMKGVIQMRSTEPRAARRGEGSNEFSIVRYSHRTRRLFSPTWQL